MEQFFKIEDKKYFRLGVAGKYLELPSTLEDHPEQHYTQAFEKFKEKVDDVCQKIDETSNKGSFLVKLIQFEEELETLEAIGDFEALNAQIADYKSQIQELINANRHKNHQQKHVILSSLNQIIQENNWKALDQVKELMHSWVRIGKATEEFDEDLNAQFEDQKQVFFENRKEYAETQKELYEARTELYRELIARIETINEQKDATTKRAEVDEIQEAWKANGSIPKSVYDTLFKLYKKVLNEFYAKLKNNRKINQKQSGESHQVVLEAKQKVLDELKAYLQKDQADFQVKDAIGFRTKWNSAGKAPGKVLGKLGDDFYLEIEYLFEFANLNSFLVKRQMELTAANQLKFMNRFRQDTLTELSTFKENKENMGLFAANSDVLKTIERRQKELERKLKAKDKVIEHLKQAAQK